VKFQWDHLKRGPNRGEIPKIIVIFQAISHCIAETIRDRTIASMDKEIIGAVSNCVIPDDLE